MKKSIGQAAKQSMSPLYYSVFPSPIGLIYAAATEKGVCRLTYDVSEDEYETDLMNRYDREVIYTSNAPILASVEDQIERYFMSELTHFDIPLDFLEGTPFYQRVWRTQQNIPFGQVRSYKWVAEQVGKPRAARAVGQANRNSRISILVPCHRVISHSGHLGGYGDRLDMKAFLLDHEGAKYKR
jgi:methylated-DNA-[protein]-cysteine S-methyltransferase